MGQLYAYSRGRVATMTGKMNRVLSQERRCRWRRRPRDVPRRQDNPHDTVNTAERVQCGPHLANAESRKVPASRIPNEKPTRAFQSQLGTLIQLVSHQVGAKQPDPLKVDLGRALLQATVGTPDTDDVLGGGRDWGRLIEGLSHGAGILST